MLLGQSETDIVTLRLSEDQICVYILMCHCSSLGKIIFLLGVSNEFLKLLTETAVFQPRAALKKFVSKLDTTTLHLLCYLHKWLCNWATSLVEFCQYKKRHVNETEFTYYVWFIWLDWEYCPLTDDARVLTTVLMDMLVLKQSSYASCRRRKTQEGKWYTPTSKNLWR